MSIAFIQQPGVGSFPPSGSLPVWLHEVARRLSAVHRVVIVAGRSRQGAKRVEFEGVPYRLVWQGLDARMARLVDRLIRVARIRTSLPQFASYLHYVVYALTTGWMLRRWKPDIVHVMNYSQFIPMLRFFAPRSMYVLHMHCEWLGQLAADPIRNRLARTDLVVGCSDHVTSQAANRFKDLPIPFATVSNGTYFGSLKDPAPVSSVGEAVRLLYVGRISPEKGVHVLLEALAVLDRRDIHLDLVGPAVSAPYSFIAGLSTDERTAALARFYQEGRGDLYQSEIRDLADHLGSGRVSFVGPLPYSEVWKRYEQADIFVFPSVWNEPFGMPVVEAMAAGLPVVATNAGGLAEMLNDGKTGILVERGSADALAEAILHLVENPPLRQAMGREARIYSQRYSWDAVADTLEGLLSRLDGSKLERQSYG